MDAKQIRIVFMGTPDFAVPSLELLHKQGYQIQGVVTQPDRPQGRKRELLPTPVKEAALALQIPVFQPEKVRAPEAVQQIREWQPDVIVTAAYGQILPPDLLSIPPHGCLNVHASLLPKYRGGAPIHYAIMNGEKKTGVTLMYMAEGLDTGDMISKVEVPIGPNDTVGEMFNQLSDAGARLLVDTLPELLAGKIQAEKQNHDEATFAPNITKALERIDWMKSAEDIHNHIRGMNPWPVAHTLWNGDRLKIWTSQCLASTEKGEPGRVVNLSAEGLDVECGQGILRIKELQPAGKRRMNTEQFVQGTTMKPGEILGVEE